MIGHSLGDYVAACLAGVFTRDDALDAWSRAARGSCRSCHRGRCSPSARPLARSSSFLVPSVSIAGFNAPKLTVISGDHAVDLVGREGALESRWHRGEEQLATSHAFHSPMMDPIVERFAEIVTQVPLQRTRRLRSSRASRETGSPTQRQPTPAYWARQLREPVRFADGAGRLLADPGRVFLEVGPGQTLDHAGAPTAQRRSRTGDRRFALAHRRRPPPTCSRCSWQPADCGWLERTWTGTGVHGHVRRQRVPLPTYPFERKRYWVDPVVTAAGEADLRPPVPEAAPVDETSRYEKHMNESMLAEAVPHIAASNRRHRAASDALLRAVGSPGIGAGCQRLLSRARPRLALPHSGEHGDPQDLRGEGRIPRSPRGRFDAGSGRRPDRGRATARSCTASTAGHTPAGDGVEL